MTTFKAVEGWLDSREQEDLRNGCDVVVDAIKTEGRDKSPCTIIPGHWAERIESGELLTALEVIELYDVYMRNAGLFPNGTYYDFGKFLSDHIARKLRGEA